MRKRAEPGPSPDENERLRARLREVEETLRAIRSGEVDALVVETAGEDQVFTLHGADQTYRLMVEQMQKGAATLSADGLVLYCNPFLASLLGVPIAQVLGVSLQTFLDPPTGLTFPGLLRAMKDGVSRGEILFKGVRGPVLTQVSITELMLPGGVVHCMIVTDLTERKRQEEERVQLGHEQMARAAAEEANAMAQIEIERRRRIEESLLQAEMDRTQLLERERLARKEAEEANRLKDEFLATLSHELRTPLSAILTWSHVLRQPGLDAAVLARAVDAIDRNARAQSALVADLLDVSRIVAGNFGMTVSEVRLGEVIELAAETVRPAARIKNIRLDVTIDPAIGPVTGDANRLQQVMWNLLSNAIRLTPVGGCVSVTVSSAGAGALISVMDNGAGIEPAFLPYVFDRFRQADSSSTRRHAGLGLGLAIVRHLVELHGGEVEAKNREDRPGAVFTVSLPLAAGPGSTAVPSSHEALMPEPVSGNLQSLAGVIVLLVDDDIDALEGLALVLGHYGARVSTAASSRDALAILLENPPHVIVADIGMPGEDGHAFLQTVRALSAERGGTIPAIALTAYAAPQDRLDTLHSGFELHIAKPVNPRDLAAAVATLAAIGGRLTPFERGSAARL